MSQPRFSLVSVGKRAAVALGDVRQEEYDRVLEFIEAATQVLDVGCGTGTLLAVDPTRFIGVDLNPDNVNFCKARGLNAQVGNALDLPFEDASFDAVTCSHVMQVFTPDQAATFVRELARVVRPGGVVVITTLNWFPQFFRHPENVRAYPPAAINAYFASQHGAQSPMFPDMPALRQTGIWCRRPPLLALRSARRTANRICGVVNLAQYRFGLRRWWTYDAFVIQLTKGVG